MSTPENDLREQVAKKIHNSRLGVLRWENLPESPRNPQRYRARQAADALLPLFAATRTAALEEAAVIAADCLLIPDSETEAYNEAVTDVLTVLRAAKSTPPTPVTPKGERA